LLLSCFSLVLDESSTFYLAIHTLSSVLSYTGYTQKNGAVSKVNKKFISHLTRAQRTPSAAATVQVSQQVSSLRPLAC
jgi:hypothetical protein